MAAWTLEENAQLIRLRGENLGFDQIAILMGRGKRSVQCQARWLAMTELERDAMRERKNRARRITLREASLTKREHPEPPPPDYVLRDRDRRSAERVTLTAFLCGDPTPSRSALAQRRV